MSAPRVSGARVFGRYLLFQVPGWGVAGVVLVGLVEWNVLGPLWAAAAGAAWVVKDLVLFPFVRVGYEPGHRDGTGALLGCEAVARDGLAPGAGGWVPLGPELWRARLVRGAGPVPAGGRVRVVRVDVLTLVVEPLDAAPPAASGDGAGGAEPGERR